MGERIESRCRVVVDRFEDRTVSDVLAALGAVIETRRLPLGDYLLPGGVLVERKTILDLHESVIRGRFGRQIGTNAEGGALLVSRRRGRSHR